VERSGGSAARKETGTIASSSSHSVPLLEPGPELLRRFVEAARRAQIVTIVNLARSETELGELFTAELCEAFEAEIAFVLAARDGGAFRTLVGAYGLTARQRANLLDDERCAHAVDGEGAQLYQGDLLGIGVRELVLAPFGGQVDRGVVGVARLYDEPFDEGEVALLEAVAESIKHALERIRLGEEREVLFAREHAARRDAEATAERLVRLQTITETVLSDLPLETMLLELLERVREIVTVDAAAILLVEGPEAEIALRAAAGAEAHANAAVELAQREGIVQQVLDEHREITVGVAIADQGDQPDRQIIRALIGVPMVVEQRIVGVLVAGALVPRAFSSEDSLLLGLAADRAAIAIENARLYSEAEERGQAARVLGSVADGVFLVDAKGAVQLWNPAAEAITGVPAKAVQGRQVEEVISGWQALDQAVAIASQPTASTRPATTFPVEIRGRELWLSVTGVSFAEGTVYAFRDLTEERRLEELKADFIATVSHELRTPVAAVHGAAQTLEREDIVFTDDVRRQLLSVISDQSERLARLVEDILLTSQVESGGLALASGPVDVADVVSRVIEAARAHAPNELSLELIASPALAPVAADRDKLLQVLANLVANAIKYSLGTGRVEVRLESSPTHLRIAVRDEGVGIPEREQERIFEKFYRLPDMSHAVSGTGLGLYICRELVRRMGGTIWVESREGVGSTFFVELPFASAPTRESDSTADRGHSPSSA
jgi:PAS domain S-box-containing protein